MYITTIRQHAGSNYKEIVSFIIIYEFNEFFFIYIAFLWLYYSLYSLLFYYVRLPWISHFKTFNAQNKGDRCKEAQCIFWIFVILFWAWLIISSTTDTAGKYPTSDLDENMNMK